MLIHYQKSAYGGFVFTQFNVDIKKYSQQFDHVEGSESSSYAVILLKSDISHSYFERFIYLNDLDECDTQLRKWLSQRKETKPMFEQHYYGNIVDLTKDIELGFGDAWSDDSKGWATYAGITEE